MRWVSEDGSVDEPAWGALYFAGAQPQVWLPRCRAVHPVDPAVDPFVAAISSARPAMELPPGAEATICGAIRSVMRGRGVQLPSREDFGLQPEQPPELVLCVEGSPLDLQARVEAHYDFGRFELRPGAPDPGRDVDLLCLQQEVPNDFRRDSETESAALGSLASAGLCWDENRRTFVAVDHQAGLFWQRGAAALREGTPPFKLMVPEALRRTYWRPKVRSLVSVDLLENNVNATVQFDAGGVLVELRAVLEAIVARRRWVELRDGTVTELPDAIVDLADDVCDVLPVTGQAAVEPFHLGRLDRWVEVADEVRVDQGAANLCARLRAMALHDEPELPRRMRAKLRDYQRQGLAWLQLLDAIGAGGILADDMGLGKTLMTLVLLLWRKQRDGPCPSLVVCPRSVVGNWEAEAKKFTPSLRVARFDGAGGIALLSDLRKVDILVTSYGLLRRHAELLRDCPFRYAILDEAQYIKTANAQTTRAAGMLRAERRLALTGTPIENHLIELWSIVDFVNPGMLGTQKEFDLRFARPIHANPESPRAARLRAGVRPFVLRRTKAQVLTDLPPMQEIEMGCTPSEAQRELYDKLAKLARREVRKLLQEQGLSKSHVHVLAVLMRLRQCAIDPRLVDERSPAHASAKREVFLGLVRALRDEGRRALVFSQFVQVLSLWRKDLDREGIAYEYLDGSTRDRDQIVERFQQGSAPLFLISLRAGGSGLNLTAADTVILCDPWWNPAVEDQAAGRSHRIGQKRAVTVIRLVTRGTIEDKIEVLKARKRKIADAILAEGNASLGGLTEGDLERLLSDVNGQVADDETDEESCAS
jgi:superfamily II DNA or RNA helicase